MEKAADAHFFVPENYFRRLRPEDIFADAAEKPLEVDLGAGDGTFLAAMAGHYPERNFLGVERLLGRARKICRKAARQELENLKVLRLESAYTVEWLLPAGCVSRAHLLFPDPWPKKKHHRRRLVNREFLAGLTKILVAGGEFLFKTDHREYDEAVGDEVRECGWFEVVPWLDDGEFYAETDFEQQWKSAGKQVMRRRFRGIARA